MTTIPHRLRSEWTTILGRFLSQREAKDLVARVTGQPNLAMAKIPETDEEFEEFISSIARSIDQIIQPRLQDISEDMDNVRQEMIQAAEKTFDNQTSEDSKNNNYSEEGLIKQLPQPIHHILTKNPASIQRETAHAIGDLALFSDDPDIKAGTVFVLVKLLDDDDLVQRTAARALADISRVEPLLLKDEITNIIEITRTGPDILRCDLLFGLQQALEILDFDEDEKTIKRIVRLAQGGLYVNDQECSQIAAEILQQVAEEDLKLVMPAAIGIYERQGSSIPPVDEILTDLYERLRKSELVDFTPHRVEIRNSHIITPGSDKPDSSQTEDQVDKDSTRCFVEEKKFRRFKKSTTPADSRYNFSEFPNLHERGDNVPKSNINPNN